MRPRDAEDRALVADLDVAPDELGDEMPVAPERLRLLDEEEAPPLALSYTRGSDAGWITRGSVAGSRAGLA